MLLAGVDRGGSQRCSSWEHINACVAGSVVSGYRGALAAYHVRGALPISASAA